MDSFIIGNGTEYIKVYNINFDGADYIDSLLEVRCGDFNYNGKHYPWTTDLKRLLSELEKCQEIISGRASYTTIEHDLAFTMTYDFLGHVKIEGAVTDYHNKLYFDLGTDQTYIAQTILQLKEVLANIPNQ